MGNKRTYRSVPEARFVKRALETASGKNIDDAIANIGRILRPGDKFTSKDLKALVGCPQLYFQTEYRDTIFPAELIIDDDSFETATLIVHCIAGLDAFTTSAFYTAYFNLEYNIDVTTDIDNTIPEVYSDDRTELNVGFLYPWDLQTTKIVVTNNTAVMPLNYIEYQLLGTGNQLEYFVTDSDNQVESDTIFYIQSNLDTSQNPVKLFTTSSSSCIFFTWDSNDSFNESYTHKNEYDLLTFLSSSNVKTFFGNKSIIKDPKHPEDNNIDLYKHYLELTAGGKTFRGVIQSSNNLDCTGVGTKLVTLLKCKAGQTHYYEHFLDMTDTGSEYALYYNGSILQLTDGTSDPINITNVVDKVETV